MREGEYQTRLIDKIERLLPGCIVLKNDAQYRQGIPDLLVLYGSGWAALEVKTSRRAPIQPNQEYYIDAMDGMSFASFIYPAIEEDVLDALQLALRSRRTARVSQRV